NAAQIANAIAVGIGKRARIDLVDDSLLPPFVFLGHSAVSPFPAHQPAGRTLTRTCGAWPWDIARCGKWSMGDFDRVRAAHARSDFPTHYSRCIRRGDADQQSPVQSLLLT